MESKTPKFDSLLDKIFEELSPHTRPCKWSGEHMHCEGQFEITSEDIEFLKMLRVPAPNFCPTGRSRRRFLYMGIFQVFKHQCDVPGHKESMISTLPPECPFLVYDYKYFIYDEFNAFTFGQDYDSNISPMETLFQLRKIFPMPSLTNRDPSSVNSDYSNGGRNLKNGYYAFGCYGSEDIWYSHMAGSSKEVMDSSFVYKSDHIYNGFHTDNSHKSSFIYFSKDCADSIFLFDCRNCIDCFGCVNMRNVKYCIWNQQVSKEDYENFMGINSPFSRDFLNESKEKFWQSVKSNPMNASRNTAVKNVTGVLLSNTKNIYDITQSENSEHIRHADGGLSNKDSMDFLYSGGHSELLYSTTNIGSQSSNVKFSISSKFCTNCEFIFNSKNLDNCFMCFGLQNKSYCILNKQYLPEKYFKILDEIKSDMMKRGEYGDGVEMQFSAMPYNFSLAQISFPLTNEEIKKLGGYIVKEPETNAGNAQFISTKDLPQVINKVSDDIINFGIKCEVTGRPFRIVESELQFLRKMKLPLPSTHPSLRLQQYLYMAPLGKRHQALCAKCGEAINSLFNPKDGYILYCEKCYQQEVY